MFGNGAEVGERPKQVIRVSKLRDDQYRIIIPLQINA
jgi:hypothetical protein